MSRVTALSRSPGRTYSRLGYQHPVDGDTAFPYLTEKQFPLYCPTYIQDPGLCRADEKSWQARYDLDFAQYGIPGLMVLDRATLAATILLAVGWGRSKELWNAIIELPYTIPVRPAEERCCNGRRNAMSALRCARPVI